MATYGSLEQALVAQAVQPATLPVALGDGEHEREVAGGSGVQETLLPDRTAVEPRELVAGRVLM